MERTKPKIRPDAILSSDWHIRETQPVCRLDDFVGETQWRKMDFISELQKKYDCPVIHAGDLFEYWKPSPWLLSMTMEHLPNQFYTIYGQHDLPQHNFEERHRSGIYALEKAGKLTVLPGVHWNQEPERPSFSFKKNWMLVWHILNYQGKKLWPGAEVPMAAKLLRKYSDYNVILTGDNHKPFVEKYEDRILVNPGSLSRQDADQIAYLPRVYLYFDSTNSVDPVYIPIADNVVSREHIREAEQRDERIEAFISNLTGDWTTGLSFENNLAAFFRANKVRSSVEKLTYKAIENERD